VPPHADKLFSQPNAITWWAAAIWSVCWGALIVAATVPPAPLSRALGWRPLAALGVISYSVYLYNQSYSLAARHLWPGVRPGSVLWVCLSAVTVAVVGIAGYLIAERPFLGFRARLRRDTGEVRTSSG